MGGKLWQDMQAQNPKATIQHMQKAPGNIATHYIEIDSESRLHDVLGDGLYVNSRHREAIKKLADGLRVTARSRDGIVEATESVKNDLITTVQWHPENMEEKVMDPLFKAFAERVKRWMV